MPQILLVVATPLEAKYLPKLSNSSLVISGLGAVNAALSTQAAILEKNNKPDLVLSVGIAGAYSQSGLALTDCIVSSQMVYAGLGVQNGSRVEALGFPITEGIYQILPAWQHAKAFADTAKLEYGVITTVETVTTDMARANAIQTQFNAAAEAMEGAGIAQAAWRYNIPTLELRSISNIVGDRQNWQLQAALERLAQTLEDNWEQLIKLL